jgi:hypothetical protein
VAITGPIETTPSGRLLYIWDVTLAPNQWIKWSTSVGPAVISLNRLWDPTTMSWVRQAGSTDGRTLVDLERVMGTNQTPDDWTQRFMALNDETVLGIAQALGLPALPTTVDAIADNTVRRFLELILAALGGTPNETHETIVDNAPGGGGWSAGVAFATNVEAVLILCETAPCEVRTRKTDGVTWNTTGIVIKRNQVLSLPVQASGVRVRNRGGAAGPPNATITVTGVSA